MIGGCLGLCLLLLGFYGGRSPQKTVALGLGASLILTGGISAALVKKS
jgi:hypothetical protein